MSAFMLQQPLLLCRFDLFYIQLWSILLSTLHILSSAIYKRRTMRSARPQCTRLTKFSSSHSQPLLFCIFSLSIEFCIFSLSIKLCIFSILTQYRVFHILTRHRVWHILTQHRDLHILNQHRVLHILTQHRDLHILT